MRANSEQRLICSIYVHAIVQVQRVRADADRAEIPKVIVEGSEQGERYASVSKTSKTWVYPGRVDDRRGDRGRVSGARDLRREQVRQQRQNNRSANGSGAYRQGRDDRLSTATRHGFGSRPRYLRGLQQSDV